MEHTVEHRRTLGPAGPRVPTLALGSWNTWDRMSDEDAVRMIVRAVEADAGFFDVAHYDMGPHAENSRTDLLFGEAFRRSGVARDDVFLCGKLWLWEWPQRGFREQLTTSLARIGVDRFDAVVVGDFAVAPQWDQLIADVGELFDENLFSTWGISSWYIGETRTALAAADALGVQRPGFAQLKYSVARRAMAEGAAYRELFEDGTLSLQASDVFEGGVLLGNAAPSRKIGADIGGIRERIIAVAPEFARIAAEFDATPAQAAIAFCLADSATANVLFGASRLDQLESNLRARELAARHGAELRAAVAGLALDQEVPADGSTSVPTV